MKRILIILCTLLMGCKDDNENLAPSSFNIMIDNITFDSVSIGWTESIDPEGGVVNYEFYLNNSLLNDKLTDRTIQIDTLTQDTEYEIKIIARDELNNLTEEIKNFTTQLNLKPSNFNIIIDTVTFNFASISWTESVDPEGGAVKYKIYLNDELVDKDITNRMIEFDTLTQGNEYEIKIIASDDYDNQQEAYKTFKTTSYIYGEFIKNGLFENVDLPFGSGTGSCQNITNNSFNLIFPDILSFGFFESVAILSKDCSNPFEGDYSISLCPENEFFTPGSHAAISFSLTQALEITSNYTLEFYFKCGTTSNTVNEIEIGYSDQESTFGTLIDNISQDTEGNYNVHSITFTPNYEAKYLTIRLYGVEFSCCSVDNFKIEKI